jgi:hypothetical protein
MDGGAEPARRESAGGLTGGNAVPACDIGGFLRKFCPVKPLQYERISSDERFDACKHPRMD